MRSCCTTFSDSLLLAVWLYAGFLLTMLPGRGGNTFLALQQETDNKLL
jgi:hypothetical protein